MKKLVIILFLVVASCSENNTATPSQENTLLNTSWTAQDPIASVLYGNGCTTTLQFNTNTTCLEILQIPTGVFAGTRTKTGTYTFANNTLTWVVEGVTKTATLQGNTLVSTIIVNNTPITYVKN